MNEKLDILKDLTSAKKISDIENKIYLIFEVSDLGREFLKLMCDSVLMEEPLDVTKDYFAWHDGRRSVWRHIKLTIFKINKMLDGEKEHDGRKRRYFE